MLDAGLSIQLPALAITREPSFSRIAGRQTMTDASTLGGLVEQALKILTALGIPTGRMTAHRKKRMAKAFIAVAALKPGMSWKDMKTSDENHRPRTRDVIAWMNKYLEESVSSGSYDDVRRRDLVLPTEAGIILKAAGNKDAATNDGTRGYAIPACQYNVRHLPSSI